MVACATMPLEPERQPNATESLERDYYACKNLLEARGYVPGARLDGDAMLLLLYLLRAGPGHCEFVARHAYRSPQIIAGLAKRFEGGWSERKTRYVLSRLKRVSVGGKPLLELYLAAPLDCPVPWAPDRVRRGPNLYGYRIAVVELRAELEAADQRERLERHELAQQRARRRALASVSAPLPKPRPEPCAVREDDPRVLEVERAWEALGMPPGTSGRGTSLERDGRRTIAARLAAGWSLDELLAIVAGAGADAQLRAGKVRLPWAYAFAGIGGLMQRYAAAGRIVLAASSPPAPPLPAPAPGAVTEVQNTAPSLGERSSLRNHGSLKTTTAGERQAAQSLRGPSPSAPRSRPDTPTPHAPQGSAPLSSPRLRASPSGPPPPALPRETRGEGEQAECLSQVRSGSEALRLLDAGDVTRALARKHRERWRRP